MHFVYIIYSRLKDRFYIGETKDIKRRLDKHNSGFYNNASTKFTKDWKLFLTIKCNNRSQALKLERYIKKMRNRKFYQKLQNNADMVNSLLTKFSN
ncbi:GIY-YIG nuclease family protein [Saccharicrinis sp. FJH2]|uniref:GIY-YIG nuclease family protein n=1 Tax=Saccharicrinis sp. FJH65 TaxID=3344659 RepID=UPI0035F262B6